MPDTQFIRQLVLNAKNRLEEINVEDLRSSKSTEFDRKRIQKKLEQWREQTVRELAPHLTEAKVSELCGIDIIENLTGVGFLDSIIGQNWNSERFLLEYNRRRFREFLLLLLDDLDLPSNVILQDMPDVSALYMQKIFISYAWANDGVVLAIDQWLRNKGLKTRIDKRDFFAGSRIRDEIMRVMSECEIILIFYSSQSRDKPWIQFEREFAADIEMSSKIEGRKPPRIIYVVLDDTPLPSVSEKNRLAVMAKGKKFEFVCDEIYQNILQIPRTTPNVDLSTWSGFTF